MAHLGALDVLSIAGNQSVIWTHVIKSDLLVQQVGQPKVVIEQHSLLVFPVKSAPSWC